MANYRQIKTRFWHDPFIQDLTPEQKYCYLYLISNPATTQCGIYEITYKHMAFETGYNTETIGKLIDFFTAKNKIIYSADTNEI